MANVACRELDNTNIRFNEVHLAFRVDYDDVAKDRKGSMPSSVFAAHYEELLKREDIRGCRVTLRQAEDIKDLKFGKKLSF